MFFGFLALHETRVLIHNPVITANGVPCGSAVCTLVIAEAVADVVEFDVTGFHDAIIEVCETVFSADGHIGERALEPVIDLAGSVMLFGNVFACDFAVVLVGLVIVSANGFVQVGWAHAAIGVNADSLIIDNFPLAFSETLVVES